jgi:hypothetical protein
MTSKIVLENAEKSHLIFFAFNSSHPQANFVGFGPVNAHQSGIYETRSSYSTGGHSSSSSSYIPRSRWVPLLFVSFTLLF